MAVKKLELDAMVRSIEINRGSPHALFLGAGASLSSGIPSAANCIWQWKRSIFETKNPELKAAVAEVSLPSVQKRIDDWLKSNSIWPDLGGDEYGYFIEKCLPIIDDRRRFFQKVIKEAKPYVGYRLLALLAEERLIRSAWTTNFDGLVAKALLSGSNCTPIEVGLDSQNRSNRQATEGEVLCVSFHGDYRYDKLRNTVNELQQQEVELAKRFTDSLVHQSLIVSGYSGRDKSIMQMLELAIVVPNAKGNVYWCGFSEEPEESVATLLDRANTVGREAFYVQGVSFDELMIRLGRQCLTNDRVSRADTIIGGAINTTLPFKTPFNVRVEKANALIKGNLFPLSTPSDVYSFAIKNWPDKGVWKWLRQLAIENGFLAVPLNGNVLAFSTIDQIKEAFGDELDGSIERLPINDLDLGIVNGAVHSLVRESLILSIANYRTLSTDGKHRLWENAAIDRETFRNRTYAIHRSAVIDLRLVEGKLHIAIDPTFFVPDLEEDHSDDFREVVKKRLGFQHNNKYDDDLKYWLRILAGECREISAIEFDFPAKTAAFRFKLNLIPSFAEIDEGKSVQIAIASHQRPHVKFRGRLHAEPKLQFATEAGWNPTSDTLPLRGLLEHGPFDSASVRLLPQPSVNLSVICPKPEAKMLSRFLSTYNQAAPVAEKRQGEYVVDYKGFESVFRCGLIVPELSSNYWLTIPEISTTEDVVAGCREWTKNICDALTTLSSLGRSVVLIASPARWDRFRMAEKENESFNVHDDVKAFAVRRGIATQFLDQDTWSPYDQSRIWWWLSLAIYTKAMRTPWVLESLDPNSAFVGLGYSVNHGSSSSERLVVGCSHVYNAQGQGLQFRLRNISDAKIRQDRNPYLSFNEARQMGETIRQLFWESHYRLPDRVVVHKLFPFLSEEIKGLKAGLSDIKSLELLEINHEPSLRFLKSTYSNGKFQIDGYPIRRGTTVKISSDELLLWVHGATEGLSSGKTYFQGKRRIPGPIVVRRYAGTSDVATVVNEILGLSKMDWNSGDLYSHLPVTVKSSKEIARIGRRLAAAGSSSFDYRLFM